MVFVSIGIRKILVLIMCALNVWAAPLLLLPLFLTDEQGRRWVAVRTGLCIFGVGFLTILFALATNNWHVVAPYAETSFAGLLSLFNGKFTLNPICGHLQCMYFHLDCVLAHNFVAFFGVGVSVASILAMQWKSWFWYLWLFGGLAPYKEFKL